jgi:uracil-DNA glycosylase family 4
MFEDDICADCQLGPRAMHPCLPSIGEGESCRLAIYLDHPNVVEDKRGRSWVGKNAEFVLWCLSRMGISLEYVHLDYVVKCYPPNKLPGKKPDRMACVSTCSQYRNETLPKLPNLKAIVMLGNLGCELVTGSKEIGLWQGSKWPPLGFIMKQIVKEVWIGYSPGYILEKPSEAGGLFRVLWRAAEDAGLRPVVTKVKPFDFDI